MLLFGRGLQLLELLCVGIALGVEGFEGAEGRGGKRSGQIVRVYIMAMGSGRRRAIWDLQLVVAVCHVVDAGHVR
jgi:hypothetical protein